MLRVGIMGIWHVHTMDYLRQLRANGDATVLSVWDEDEALGRQFAAEQGLTFEPDLDTFLGAGIDAVVCTAPTTRHGDLLTRAAAAKKHIFTEKLLATNTAEALRICEAIEAAGVVCTVSLPLLASPAILHARALIEAGTLGRVTGARMRRSHGGVSDSWLPERWFDVGKSGGGALMDLGAHPVYVLSFLLGAPKRVSGMMTNLYGTTSDENAIALVEFDGGVLATCETAFVTYGVPDLLEVYGTEGAFYMHGGELRVATKGMAAAGVAEAAPTRLPAAPPPAIAQFVQACLSGGPAPQNLGPRDAVNMTRIIEAAYASDDKGQTIKL